ncbi:MAG: saccharopine dehydrogenase NADP-binding domain-containing protein [Thermosynechococcaceae cyanobacterium MS004]|nr:saccharopine dehydrogenase NADP-binding domain-containing protein [Thermosynechococcaceae cyanobacterium MS004]
MSHRDDSHRDNSHRDDSHRGYDVVLYGASGFVGRQTVQYFAEHPHGKEIRWAIAGRDRQKLEAVKAQAGGLAATADLLIADSQDQAAVDEMVARTKVVLNTAGPFALYGTTIVDACVRLKTHYVDITGETPWVKTLIERYHEQAASEGTRIIPFCGFDSIPSDLGTYLVVRDIQEQFGVSCKRVKGYFQAMGGFNGGTLASGLNLYESGQSEKVGNPFLLNPPGIPLDSQNSPDPMLPEYDAEIDAWVGPFFMGAINTRVVRRSSALFEQWQSPYGSDFSYQEYMKFDNPWGWLKAAGVTAGLGLFAGAMSFYPTRQWLRQYLPQPGTGPSEQTMNNGWFRCELMGEAEDGRRVRGLISDKGDPGNRATVKFLCESALSLVLNPGELPGGQQRGGILTPATALGNVLAHRLRQAGMTITVESIKQSGV